MREWALVLEAAGVPHRVAQGAGGWELRVAAADARYAALALEAYDREARAGATHAPGAPEHGWTPAGLVAALLLLVTYRLTGPHDAGGLWHAHGAAAAGAIAGGEWWRTVTALTLHAGPTHVLGNVAACAVLVTAVCRVLGPGLGLALVLLSGTAGNAVNAVLRDPRHESVGASTAIFGALGILGGLAAVRPGGRPRRGAWVPIAASLALLGLLGTGEGSDLGAHLLGLAAGLGLGAAAGRLVARPPGAAAQTLLMVAAGAAVAGCWLLALH